MKICKEWKKRRPRPGGGRAAAVQAARVADPAQQVRPMAAYRAALLLPVVPRTVVPVVRADPEASPVGRRLRRCGSRPRLPLRNCNFVWTKAR